jgi:four helix bundle protein
MQNCNSKFKIDIKKRAYLYALNAIKFFDSLPKHDLSSHVIGNQLLRSTTSIGANAIEAQAASSEKEFTTFPNHSLKFV